MSFGSQAVLASMTADTSRRSVRPSRRLTLSSRMSRVLKALRRVQKSADPESVHRLRVALRRCRSLAMLMEEVDLHPYCMSLAWWTLGRTPRVTEAKHLLDRHLRRPLLIESVRLAASSAAPRSAIRRVGR